MSKEYMNIDSSSDDDSVHDEENSRKCLSSKNRISVDLSELYVFDIYFINVCL